MHKFDGVNDLVLIELFRKGNRDAEIELINRYTARSVNLAETLLKSLNMQGFTGINDLVNIGLLTMYDAMKTYKHVNSFYAYWKKIATNNMMEEVDRSYKSYDIGYFGSSIDYAQESLASERKDMLEHEIEDAFNDPKNYFKADDKTIFYMVLDGYSLQEIADIYHLTYQAISYRLKRITSKLSDILFNSNE